MSKKINSRLNLKQKLISKGIGFPSKKEGRDGDLAVRYIKGQGIFLCYKWAGSWFTSRMNLYDTKSSELKEPVKLPIGKKPSKVGEISLIDGKPQILKSRGNKGQILSVHPTSKLADVEEIVFNRTSTTSMSSENAGIPDFELVNTSGHAHLHIGVQNATYDPFIRLSHEAVGESPSKTQWTIGMDNSDSNNLKFHYNSAGGTPAPMTPSSSSGTGGVDPKLILTYDGNIEMSGTINSGGLTGNTNLTGGHFLIDRNITGTTSATNYACKIDYDDTGNTAGGQTKNNIGLDLELNSDSQTNSGTVNDIGIDIDIVGGTDGTSTATGIAIDVDGADTNIGLLINTAGTHIKMEANADTDDYGSIAVADTGDMTITTVGDGTTDSDLLFEIDGDVQANLAGGDWSWFVQGGGGPFQMIKLGYLPDLGTYFQMSHILDPTDDYFRIEHSESNRTTKIITASDDGGGGSHLIFDVEGQIQFDSSVGDVYFYNSGTPFAEIDMDTASTFKFKSVTDYTLQFESSGTGDTIFDSGGDIIFDSHDGNFIAKKAGTEFSVANSAYAGMILGYRMIGEDNAHESYTMTNSYAVPDADMTVRFVAPPSGAVEVMVQIHANASTAGRYLYFGLSDSAIYNSIGNSYEQFHRMPDETDDEVCQHYWTITGLTAGTTYNYWFGAKINATTAWLNWGGTGASRYCDFIMKVTALPAAVSNFAEYD